MDYKRNEKYFRPLSLKPGIIMAVIGLSMIPVGGLATFLGLLLAAGGGGWLYMQFSDRPTDNEIDRAAKSQLHDLTKRATDKLGVDEEEVKLIEPIAVGGYDYSSSLGRVMIKRGKDGVIRSSNYEGVVIYFSEHQLHAYKFSFSLIEENHKREMTDEYFYRDVVSIATSSESEQVYADGKSETVNFEVFKLTTSGGTSVASAMRDTDGGGTRSIQGARQLIRDRKLASG